MGEGATEWETSNGHGHAGADGIYRFYYHPKQRVTLTSARQAMERRIAVARGVPHPLYVDMRGLVELAKDAREAFSADPSVTALALRTGNAVSRVIANFFLGLHKPKVPVRLVGDEAEGVSWLQQFVARGGDDARRSSDR